MRKLLIKKPLWIKNIKVICWDLDTTLYREIPELTELFDKTCRKLVAVRCQWTYKKAAKLYNEKLERLGSNSKTIAYFLGEKWLKEELKNQDLMTEYLGINKFSFIKRDGKLKEMFAKLKNFRHFIVTNDSYQAAVKTLQALGLSVKIFEKIVSREATGTIKPDLAQFQLVLELTGLAAKKHLMVGDRDKVDLAPAKKLGMRTAMVWRESEMADVSLVNVYEIRSLFNS